MFDNKEKNSVPNIWAAQENLMHFYRSLSAVLGFVMVLMTALILALVFRNPLVIAKNVETQEYYQSHRENIKIGKNEVEVFTKRFLEALYVWDGFNVSVLSKEIDPFTENALVAKILEAQAQKYGKELKSKKISQAITFIKVNVLDDRVVCVFDRILKIEGIPLIVPTEVTFSMIQKTPTRLNPMGIYIAGITEREGGH
ncbi:MAG: hypothetical protein K2Q26_10275 [Bdellovibrionales bacterium]|nr:hypothetical protein [Bdellovibrionales bacterium]